MDKSTPQKPKGSEDVWLNAAYDTLCDSGVEAVKVMPLAKRLGLTRTGFYWHFRDRDALLEAMIARWEAKNTGNLIDQCEAYAETICEAIFNLFDCWLDGELFDARLDLAIRNWARNDPALAVRLERADVARRAAIVGMYERFGFSPEQADVRASTVIFTQVGYISMQVEEDRTDRIMRMPAYVEAYTSQSPTPSEIARFMARHLP